MMNLLFEIVERGFEISTTKRKERNLSCVDILKDKIYLLASQKNIESKIYANSISIDQRQINNLTTCKCCVH
jgi:hypothetical protein